MIKDFIVVHPRNIFSADAYDERFDVVDMYDLPNMDLTSYTCMVVLGFVDQDFLFEERAIIEQFLKERKIVCFFGNLVTEWLPGQSLFIPKEIQHHSDYDVCIAQPHPIFEGVLEEHMTTNNGVKGFFARGHHPIQEGAEVLLTLRGGEPIAIIDRQATAGTIFLHAGNNLFSGIAMGPDGEKTTKRIPQQLITWIQQEVKQLQKGASTHA